jgi:hypothetical protein
MGEAVGCVGRTYQVRELHMSFNIVLHKEDGTFNTTVKGFASVAEAVAWRTANAIIAPVINGGDLGQAQKLKCYDLRFERLVLA